MADEHAEPMEQKGAGPSEGAAPGGIDTAGAAAAEAAALRARELEAQNLRLLADFENLRRRQSEQQLMQRQEIRAELLTDFLGIVDNLQRAVEAGGDVPEGGLRKGVELTLAAMRELLAKQGAERLKTVGEPFDPNWHQALGEEETDAVPPGCVFEELVPGWKLGERLLRPALVRVAKAGAGDASQKEG